MTARHRVFCSLALLLLIPGCGGQRKSSILLERFSRGPLDEAPTVGHPAIWELEPPLQKLSQDQVEVTVNYASPTYLNGFFSNTKLFGSFAGVNPYYLEHLVFYVTVTNKRERKIHLDPGRFRLLDDRGNQLNPIGIDVVTALAEFHAPVASTTRGFFQDARPGYFGFGLPLGKFMTSKPQWRRFILMQQSLLQEGFLYPGVIYDGLVAFWNPPRAATKLRLIVAEITSDFDAKDEARASSDFSFEFSANAR